MNMHNHKTLSVYLFIAIITSSTATYTSHRKRIKGSLQGIAAILAAKEIRAEEHRAKEQENIVKSVRCLFEEPNQTNQPNTAITTQQPRPKKTRSRKTPGMGHRSKHTVFFNQRAQAASTQPTPKPTTAAPIQEQLDEIIQDSGISFRKFEEHIAQQADTPVVAAQNQADATAVAAQNNGPESKSMCIIQ